MPSLPKYVHRFRSRNKIYYYFRQGGVNSRLPDNPGSPEFFVRYAELLASVQAPAKRVNTGTIAALIRDFKASPEFLALAAKTRTDYARMLDRLEPIERFPASKLRRQHVIRLRKRTGREATISQHACPGCPPCMR